MFELEKQIAAWRAQMMATGIKAPVPLDELESHLRDEIQGLTRSGASEEEAFQMAQQRLGEGTVLKPEFTKVGVGKPWAFLTNRTALNLVAAWFIVAGANALIPLGRFISSEFTRNRLEPSDFEWITLISIALTLVLGSQIMIGIGLLRRNEFCRGVAVGWARCALGLFLLGEFYIHFISAQAPTAPITSLGVVTIGMSSKQSMVYQFLLFSLPMVFVQIISFLNVSMLIWAYYLFTKSSVRELFHRQADAN